MKPIKFVLPTLFVLFILAAAACNGDSNVISVKNVRSPEPPPTAQNAAIYMDITNQSNSDDTLIDAKAEGCTTTEIHESYEKEDGLMGMRHLPDGVIIPAGETAVFEMGGLHIMCIGKADDYGANGRVALFLTFAQAGDIQVQAEIK